MLEVSERIQLTFGHLREDDGGLVKDNVKLVAPFLGIVGLLFIDAEHTGEAVQRDFNAWSTHVVGPVVFHDYKGGREGNGVRPVVDEIVAGPEWKFVQQGPGSIAVIRRQE